MDRQTVFHITTHARLISQPPLHSSEVFIVLSACLAKSIVLLSDGVGCQHLIRLRLPHFRQIERPSVGWIFAHFKNFVLHLQQVARLLVMELALGGNRIFLDVPEPCPHILTVAVPRHGIHPVSIQLLFDSHQLRRVRRGFVVRSRFITVYIRKFAIVTALLLL